MFASSGQSIAGTGFSAPADAATVPQGSTVQQNIPPASPARSMGSTAAAILPPTPRALPFKFTDLSNSNGKAFCRAYYYSAELSEVSAKALTLASDIKGVSEIRSYSAAAEQFLIDTMQKLGVQLP